ASLTLLTVIVNCLSKERAGEPESLVRRQIVYELLASKLKLAAELRLAPRMAKEALSGKGPPPQPVACSVKLWVWPLSGSLALSVPTAVPAGRFSLIELAESAMLVGASLRLVTV